MEIYGMGVVAACYFLGNMAGRLLGKIMGTGGNVGGVGVAMLLLVLFCMWKEKNGGFPERTAGGIKFLSAIYIPVIVAMASKQNVVAALDGGMVALLGGVLATVAGLLLVPVISKLGDTNYTFDEPNIDELEPTKIGG